MVTALRNFKLASEQRNTSQPTLSRQISHLQQSLCVAVFRRGSSGAETTREGDISCRFARAIRQTMGAVETRLFEGRRSHHRLARAINLDDLGVIDAVRRTGGAIAAAAELGCS